MFQAKEYLSAVSLRKLVSLQNELLKAAQQTSLDRTSITAPISGLPTQVVKSQRMLLSSNFSSPTQNGTRATNSLGRNILSAGDKLRDLILPESLASVVSAGMWSTGMDRLWGSAEKRSDIDGQRKLEKAREELDDLLASACPLCESVIAGLDKPFVKEGEEDESWKV